MSNMPNVGRLNVGNQVTNGMQILSVAATTASKFFKGKADSALNNMTEEQQSAYHKMKADKMIDETTEYNTKGASPKQHLTESELTDYQAHQAERMKNSIKDTNDIDTIMSDNSPQASSIKTKMYNDSEFMKSWKASLQNPEPLEEIMKDFKGVK